MPLISRLAGLCALLIAATPAIAADFEAPYPPHGPGFGAHAPPEPVFRAPPRFGTGLYFERAPEFGRSEVGAAGNCHEFVRRRFDPDGAPVVRRVRVCDEPAFERGPPPPPDDIPPRRWGGPRW